jgi:hypothetical protein
MACARSPAAVQWGVASVSLRCRWILRGFVIWIFSGCGTCLDLAPVICFSAELGRSCIAKIVTESAHRVQRGIVRPQSPPAKLLRMGSAAVDCRVSSLSDSLVKGCWFERRIYFFMAAILPLVPPRCVFAGGEYFQVSFNRLSSQIGLPVGFVTNFDDGVKRRLRIVQILILIRVRFAVGCRPAYVKIAIGN